MEYPFKKALILFSCIVVISMFRASNANPVFDSPEANEPSVALQTGAFNQEQAVAEIKAAIAGKENQPAEQVFKNIQMFKGMPAGRVLAVMQIG